MRTSAEEKMLQHSFWWWVFIFGVLFLGVFMSIGTYFVADVFKYYSYRDQFPDFKSPTELLVDIYKYPKFTIVKILMGGVAGVFMGAYMHYQKHKARDSSGSLHDKRD